MPRYDYSCKVCHTAEEREVPVTHRDAQVCETCLFPLARRFSTPHVAPIGGIPNRLNANWKE